MKTEIKVLSPVSAWLVLGSIIVGSVVLGSFGDKYSFGDLAITFGCAYVAAGLVVGFLWFGRYKRLGLGGFPIFVSEHDF